MTPFDALALNPGMKVTGGHRLKSGHGAQLAVNFTTRPVSRAGSSMHMPIVNFIFAQLHVHSLV